MRQQLGQKWKTTFNTGNDWKWETIRYKKHYIGKQEEEKKKKGRRQYNKHCFQQETEIKHKKYSQKKYPIQYDMEECNKEIIKS